MLRKNQRTLYDGVVGRAGEGANPGASPAANALGCFAKLEDVRRRVVDRLEIITLDRTTAKRDARVSEAN
jgi:hypothetical protein